MSRRGVFFIESDDDDLEELIDPTQPKAVGVRLDLGERGENEISNRNGGENLGDLGATLDVRASPIGIESGNEKREEGATKKIASRPKSTDTVGEEANTFSLWDMLRNFIFGWVIDNIEDVELTGDIVNEEGSDS